MLSPFRRGPLDILLGRWTLDSSPVYLALDLAARLFSPYDLNPGGANPLGDVLAESVDFARLAKAPIKLFITATNVRTGRGRVFRNAEITPDVLLASACLPTMFQAVEIDGEAYWDGGYAGNPTITPLVHECVSDDTILVQINPVERQGTPRSARDIITMLERECVEAGVQIQLGQKITGIHHTDGAFTVQTEPGGAFICTALVVATGAPAGAPPFTKKSVIGLAACALSRRGSPRLSSIVASRL